MAGNPTIHTPVLDRLARDGVYFTQATVNVSQCLPVRASLLTGLEPHSHGAYAHQNQTPEASRPTAFADWPTVSGLLRGAGYETVLVGKWHVASDPWRVGFSRVLTWIPSGAQRFVDPDVAHGESRELHQVDGFTQEILADDAVEYLSHRAEGAPPFMLWLAFTAPHAPFGPNPKRIEALYAGRKAEELLPPGFPRDIPTNDWRQYDEAISHLDEQVGRVLSALDRAGLAERTLVVFLGDNGFMMGERGVGVTGGAGKVVPYESSVRVPMIVRDPSLQRASGPSSAAVSSLDLPVTFLRAAGLTPPASWPGRDLAPLLRAPGAAGFEAAFTEWADETSKRFGGLAFRLVRTPTHKLIVWKDAQRPQELYDLAADPREEKNLAGGAAVRAVEADLVRRLLDHLRATDDPALSWSTVEALTPPPAPK